MRAKKPELVRHSYVNIRRTGYCQMVRIFQTNNACNHITCLHLYIACAACCVKELGVEVTRVHFPASARVDIAVLNAKKFYIFHYYKLLKI